MPSRRPQQALQNLIRSRLGSWAGWAATVNPRGDPTAVKIWKPTTESSKGSPQFPSYLPTPPDSHNIRPRGDLEKKKHSACHDCRRGGYSSTELHGTATFLHAALPIFQHLQHCWVCVLGCLGGGACVHGGMCILKEAGMNNSDTCWSGWVAGSC